jgi:hypothetical protein
LTSGTGTVTCYKVGIGTGTGTVINYGSGTGTSYKIMYLISFTFYNKFDETLNFFLG